MTLSVLVVTRGDDYGWRYIADTAERARVLGAEFVLAIDGNAEAKVGADVVARIGGGPRTYLGAVLNHAIPYCSGDYILRVDDDETLTDQMAEWLQRWMVHPLRSPQYAFPRRNLWGDTDHALAGYNYWPDHQARLAIPELTRRERIHEQWSGWVEFVDAPLLHHYYLIHDHTKVMERAAIMDAIMPGAGALAWPGESPEVRPWNS